VPISSPETALPKVSKWVRKGKRIEVYAPSKRWREAEVVKVHPDGATVHYAGYDSQFDEKILHSEGRLRPYGELRTTHLQNLKASFVYQGTLGACPGCGVEMQCTNPRALGYIPPDKFEQEPEDSFNKPLSADDEVRLLLQEEGAAELAASRVSTKTTQSRYQVTANVFLDIRKEPNIDSELQGESLGIGEVFEVAEIYRSADARTYFRLADGRGWVFDWALVKGARVPLIAPVDDGVAKIKEQKKSHQKVCQRCWSLWHYNDCDEAFRPAFGSPVCDELTADSFREMLVSTLKPVTAACVLAVVDVFDFGPSFKLLEFLGRTLQGKKGVRVRVVANKIDLLPKDVNMARIRGWVMREAQEAGLRVRLTDVFPVSCHRKEGIKAIAQLLENEDAPPAFYVVGAANAGKSSLLNRLALQKRKGPGQLSAAASDGFVVSALPGTTLKPLVMKYQRGNSKLVDMPGLLVPGSLAERLSLEDLKLILPQTRGARRITLHMMEGNSILLGGLAMIEMFQGRPFQFTVFSSEKLVVHRTQTEKALGVARRLAGGKLLPPVSKDRFEDLQPWEPHVFELEGTGWHEACCDIVFHGLGWVSITGCGPCTVKAHAPKGVDVTLRREPLMPFEAKWTGVKYKGRLGWFHIGKYTTRGNDAGRVRTKIGKRF